MQSATSPVPKLDYQEGWFPAWRFGPSLPWPLGSPCKFIIHRQVLPWMFLGFDPESSEPREVHLYFALSIIWAWQILTTRTRSESN